MINFPTSCPSCGSVLVLVNEQLYCKNSGCEAQTQKKLEHFAKTLKIRGMGPKTLEKLNLEVPVDFYTSSVYYFVDILGEKVGRKLFKEIQDSKTANFATVLAAFSIPLIGSTASEKVASVVNRFEDISDNKCRDAGLGEKATASLINWLKLREFEDLPFTFDSTSTESLEVPSNGIVVCITGKLKDYSNREAAQKYLESLGFKCTNSITKSTNVLIHEEDKRSSKVDKAEELGIEILTINQLIERC